MSTTMPPAQEPTPTAPAPRSGNGLGTASLVLGILSLVCLGPLGGILAIVFGAVAMSKAKKANTSSGQAVAGLVLGIVGTVIWGGIGLAIIGGGSSDDARDAPSVTTAAGESETASAPAAACKDTPDDQELNTLRTDLYPNRPDSQPEDSEAVVGDCVRTAGYAAYVNGARLAADTFGDQVIVVDVSVKNLEDTSQSFNYFDWRIQTADGQVLDPTVPFIDEPTLDSGSLVKGGTAAGKVVFDGGPGTYYVIYKPNGFDAARGIWEVTV